MREKPACLRVHSIFGWCGSAPLLPQFYQPKLKYGSHETEHVIDPSNHLLRRESGAWLPRWGAPLEFIISRFEKQDVDWFRQFPCADVGCLWIFGRIASALWR